MHVFLLFSHLLQHLRQLLNLFFLLLPGFDFICCFLFSSCSFRVIFLQKLAESDQRLLQLQIFLLQCLFTFPEGLFL